MHKLLVAAVTAASLGTLGLAATAQAQTAPHSIARVTATLPGQVDVAGVAQSNLLVLTKNSTTACTSVKVTSVPKLPKTVTVGTSSKANHGCTVEIEGVFPVTPASYTLTITWTQGGTTHTDTVTKTVLPQPCENDAVGVGSDTLTPLVDQLATDYNNSIGGHPSKCSKVSTTTPALESWDAVNLVTGQIGDSIPEKADCAHIARPNGSSAGITQLSTFTKSSSGPLCTNFARSSRPRGSADPPFAPGGSAFVALAGDAVTWSTPAINVSAPATLTAAQLNAIYTCTDTNWNQVGGASQTIQPFLPQSGSGTLSFFLAAIGVTTPGPCVSNVNNTLEENEGVNPALNVPGGIFIYSVGDYIAQTFHSAKCLNSSCTAVNGVICKKTPAVLQYWCNVHGTMTPREINSIAPTVGSGTSTKINPAFPATFDRTLFDVVPYDPATTDHIPGATSPVGGLDLSGIFGASGFFCSAAGSADIKAYGFVPLGSLCGATS